MASLLRPAHLMVIVAVAFVVFLRLKGAGNG